MSGLLGFSFIDDVYSRLLQEPWFRERPGQRVLSRDIFSTLTEPGSVYAAEAPTGTGKTLAYLIGGIAAARFVHKPLVVATATVTLQRQVMNQDMQSLVKVGVIRNNQFTLLKGRGRYYCPFLAESVAKVTPQSNLFPDEAEEEYRGQDMVQDMHIEFLAGRWSGDQDEWTGKVPEMWPEVSCNSKSCIGKSCSYASKCKYLKSRADAAFAEVIISNHDMVLTDLTAKIDGISVIPTESYLLVVDEGHHLPDKAVAQAACELDFECGEWLERMAEWRNDAATVPGLEQAVLDKSTNGVDLFDSTDEVRMRSLLIKAQEALAWHLPAGQKDKRFEHGLPASYQSLLLPLQLRVGACLSASKAANNCLSEIILNGHEQGGIAPDEIKRNRSILTRGLAVESRMRDLSYALDTLYFDKHPVVWAYEGKHGLGLKSSPMEGAEVLDDILWPSGMPVAIVSATLRALGSFDRYEARSGLPGRAVKKVFDPVLPYSSSELILCDPGASPKDSGFDDAIVQALADIIDPNEGTLVLFTAIGMLKRIQPRLAGSNADGSLAQFTKPAGSLVAEHKSRIDAGRGSVLMGVDSFAEGLDLPGKYCTHVIIVKLPFSRPNEPVEQARQDVDPDGYFMNNSLPDASIKLIQCAGRLVRREEDKGRISLLDNRVMFRRYGQLILASLPPFSRKRMRVGSAKLTGVPA